MIRLRDVMDMAEVESEDTRVQGLPPGPKSRTVILIGI
jgi:hypothetical protein